MIRDSYLKKYIYQTKKRYDRKGAKELLEGIRKMCSITMDCCDRTKNLTKISGLPPFRPIPEPKRVRVDAFSQISSCLDMAKAGSKQVATIYSVLLDLNANCHGDLYFDLSFSSVLKAGSAAISIVSKDGGTFLCMTFNSPPSAGTKEKADSLKGALELFEAALKSPARFAADFKRIASVSSSDFAFSINQPLAVESVGAAISDLLVLKAPPILEPDLNRIFLNQASSWTAEDFNRGVQLVNENAGCFKNVSLIYAWSPARWEEYEVLEDYYGLFGPADTDACLFEFILPSGKAGMTAMTYGKKGYRLCVSFDDGTAIKEFEKLTGVKCEVF